MDNNGNGKKNGRSPLPGTSTAEVNRSFFAKSLGHDFTPRTKEVDLLDGPPYICSVCGHRLSQKDEERVNFVRAHPALGSLHRAVCSAHSVALSADEYRLMLSTLGQLEQELSDQFADRLAEQERRARMAKDGPLRGRVARTRHLV